MCGRYGLDISFKKILNFYGLDYLSLDFSKEKEIFPTSNNLIFDGSKLFYAKWGFDVSFSKRPLINARSESVNEKITFSKHFKNSRCLIPATYFYEWKDDGKPKKTKYLIKVNELDIFSLAGIFRKNEDKIEYLILTTASKGTMKDYHSRMPVILDRENGAIFLNENNINKNLQFINSVNDGNYKFVKI